jgi:acetylornithine deacetylase
VRLDDAAVLALHREIVACPSVSGDEARLAGLLEDRLRAWGAAPVRHGNSLLALAGGGPLLLLDTHIDTVPPCPGWSRNPYAAAVEDGKVIGLGSSDAKAAVAAMAAAFLALRDEPLGITLALALVEEEETRGTGTSAVLSTLGAAGSRPAAAVVGEPTGLDVAVAQKGLMVLELVERGDGGHAAHAARLGARNAARLLARDLVALERIDLGLGHPELGPASVEPTRLRAGSARNVVPAEASAILDVRTVPAIPPEVLLSRVRELVSGEIRVLSDRLRPRETPRDAAVARAALEARPGARLYGSATLSDWALLDGVPAVKCGPGRSERSHTPDEYVTEAEVLEGARFYEALVRAYARILREG